MNDDLTEFDGFDPGWRLGTFDKCNGKDAMTFDHLPDTPFNVGFIDAYVDAYVTNERRI